MLWIGVALICVGFVIYKTRKNYLAGSCILWGVTMEGFLLVLNVGMYVTSI